MTDTTRYLIARDGAGNIIAKRATLGYHDYKFATSAGTFHSRRDLVPTGKIAWPVEEISAAEYRKLVKAKTDDPLRLQAQVDRLLKRRHMARESLAEAHRCSALNVSDLPRREVERGWNGRMITEYQVGDKWVPGWSLEPEHLARHTGWCERNLAEVEKSLANYEKRLATALRKAAKVEG